MTAVGRHYGSQVSLYSIWNEPNHPAFLLPQFNANGTPASPRIYRGLFQAGYKGLQAAGIAHPKVLMGETAPFGYDSVNTRREGAKALLHDVAPLAFLRGALCLNAHYRRSSSCANSPASGYAHHAYTKAVGPTYRPPGADNVTIGVLSRLSPGHSTWPRARTRSMADMPIYLTEFGVQSLPNKQDGVSAVPAGRVRRDLRAHRLLQPACGRVLAVPAQGRPDSAGVFATSAIGGFIGFQTGLEYVSGKRKPLYYGFPVPLVVTKRGHGYSLWGLVRPATGATNVTVLVQLKGSHRFRTLKVLRTNGAGYWALHSSTRGVSWRVRWISPAGVKYEGPPIRAY